ncbi:probable membrane-associated kinase regulator 6 isoform X2 [Chenopodium quinoa]|nr:probable membrane-associated kinase regulator 6 isoform X2 [Chenopodium quinoa]XP_021764975.1 probable membrane-associated kinase regulator 6 isoform X2 [Chenopodium quinoa]
MQPSKFQVLLQQLGFYKFIFCSMAIVESSQPLSIESFSYSWLINLKPSLESLSESFRAAMDSSDESFFIEMDPNMPASKRFKKLDKDFDFNLPFSEQTTAAIVHADELFCDGLLMPLVNSSRNKAYSDSSPCASPLSEFQNTNTASGDRKIRCSSLRRCRSLLSRKMFEKYLYFMFPLLEKLRCCRSKSKIRAADDGIWVKNKSSSFSPQASPRTSVGSFPGDMRRSCDSESSINEAVLHCKKSFGM